MLSGRINAHLFETQPGNNENSMLQKGAGQNKLIPATYTLYRHVRMTSKRDLTEICSGYPQVYIYLAMHSWEHWEST